MKFRHALITWLLSSAQVDSSLVVSKYDCLNNECSDGSEVDTARILKPAMQGKPRKDTKKYKPKKNSKKDKQDTPTIGAFFGSPHKVEYEHRTLCISGVRMHGCSDAANQKNGGVHVHDTIRGRRYVKHTGVFAAKSFCDFADEIITGAPPDITHPIGGKAKSNNSTTRSKKCEAARASGLTLPMSDPAKYLRFEAIVVENNKKYNKFTAKLRDLIDTDEKKKVYHLIQAGFTPDTIEYLEGMDGKPYVIRSTNGPDMLHETMFTNFRPLGEIDEGKSAREIARAFAGVGSSVTLEEITLPAVEIFDAGGGAIEFKLPPACTIKDIACLQVTKSFSYVEFSQGLDLSMYGSYLKTKLITAPPPSSELRQASAVAAGCAIYGLADILSARLCLEGGFTYDISNEDLLPSKGTYSVRLRAFINAGKYNVGIQPLEADATLKMVAQPVNGKDVFTGYDGEVLAKIDVVVVSAGAGIGVDYETPTYETSNEISSDSDGWALKFYADVHYEVDFFLYHKSAKFTHVFSCEPSANPVCSSSSDDNTGKLIPGSTLNTNDRLNYNEYLMSTDGNHLLWMQADGNLVLYGQNGSTWASNTDGTAAEYAIFQDDGNFVVYGAAGKVFWDSASYGKGGQQLILQDDGNLVIYSNTGEPIWKTGTDGK